jgi:5-methylcytosine-specific restriction enzyme B
MEIGVATSFEQAIREYDRSAVAGAVAAAEQQRQEVVRRFPRDQWPTMPIERYAVGLSGHRDTFCRLLEFQTPDLGSIKGGSSRKLIIYKHKDKPDWYFDPAYPDVNSAWLAVREAFVEAFSLAEAHDWAGVDNLAPLRSGAALRAKAVFCYVPAGLLPIYSREHIAHFRELLGDRAHSIDAVQDNHALYELVYQRPEFDGWLVHGIMEFLYHWADPRATRRIVKIAPGPDAQYWSDCLEGGYICVGWDEVGDLSEYPSFEDFRPVFEAKHPYGGNQGQTTRKAREVWTLTELEPGDLVVANRGTSAVVGIGVVREPGYQWRPERPEYKHTVTVDWNDTAERSIEPVRRWALTTVIPVAQALYQRILDAPAGGPGVIRPPKGPIEPTPPEPVLLDVQAAIQRKGQVILHGPPGTGKTYTARRFATWWLLSRSGADDASAVLGDLDRLRAAEAMLSKPGEDGIGQLTRVTFHPSYAYEDFVEGYKPRPTGAGGLELELRDGVFKRICMTAARDPDRPYLLVIDEINRGNVPKVFGELITLLEFDKRSMEVELAQSGMRFAVPPNLFVLGTMNTADRSIRLLDAALRRRFAFVELRPDPSVLAGEHIGPLALDSFLIELNRRIARYAGREQQVGHSFLLDPDGAPLATPAQFAAVFRHELLPLLQEFAYEDFGELARYLGRDLIDGEAQSLAVDPTGDPEGLLAVLAAELQGPTAS